MTGRFAKDLIGKTFNRLTVLKRLPNCSNGSSYWLCVCSCSGISQVRGHQLVNNKILSCGCLRKESFNKNLIDRNKALKGTHPKAIEVICDYPGCNKRFFRSPSQLRRRKGHFCSTSCSKATGNNNKGKFV